METKPPVPVYLLARELMFISRVLAEGRAAGIEVQCVRDAKKLPHSPGMLLVDLHLEGAINAAGEWQRGGEGRRTIGFVAHVDAETAKKAREAGVQKVMAKSAFFEKLPELLQGMQHASATPDATK